MVRFLVEEGYPEVEVERARSPLRLRAKTRNCRSTGVAVPISFERRQSPPRRTRSPDVVSIRKKSSIYQGSECRHSPPRRSSPQRSTFSTTSARHNSQGHKSAATYRNPPSVSPSRNTQSTQSKHTISTTSTTRSRSSAKRTDSPSRRPIRPPDFPSKRENHTQSRWSKKQTDATIQRDVAQHSVIQTSERDCDAAILRRASVSTEVMNTRDKRQQNNQDQEKRKEWKSLFRRSHDLVDERNDDYLDARDARDDLPSLIDDEHKHKIEKPKVPLWKRRWKVKRNTPAKPFKEEPNKDDKKSIDFGSIMKKLETRRNHDNCAVEMSADKEICIGGSQEVPHSNQHECTSIHLCKPIEDHKHQDSVLILNDCADPVPDTKREDTDKTFVSQPEFSEEMIAHRTEQNTVGQAAVSEEQRVERRVESTPPEQHSRQQKHSIKRVHESEAILFRKDKPVPLADDKEKDFYIPKSDYRPSTTRDELRRESYPAFQEAVDGKRGVLALSSCYQGTATVPLHLSAMESDINKTLHLYRNSHKRMDCNQNRNRLQTDEGENDQGTANEKQDMLSSCRRDTAGLPLQHSSEKSNIHNELGLHITSPERNDWNQSREFKVPVQNTLHADEKPNYQGTANNKRGMRELPLFHRDAAGLPSQLSPVERDINNQVGSSPIASRERKVLSHNRELNFAEQTDEAQGYQDASSNKSGMLAVPSCQRGTVGLPLHHSTMESDVNNKRGLHSTYREMKNWNHNREFEVPLQNTLQADKKQTYQGANKKPSSHRDAAGLPEQLSTMKSRVNKELGLHIASHEKNQHRAYSAPVRKTLQTDEKHNYQDANTGNRSILALMSCHQDTTISPFKSSSVESRVRDKLKPQEMLHNSNDLSKEKKVEMQMENGGSPLQDTIPITGKSPRSLSLLLQQNWNGFGSESAVLRHNLLSFSSFSHASGDTSTVPLASQIPSTFARGLDWMYGAAAGRDLLFSGSEEVDGEEECDSCASGMESSMDVSTASSWSIEVSEFKMAENITEFVSGMDHNGIYSDISSYSSSYFSSRGNSQDTLSSSEEKEIGKHFVNSVGDARLRQIASELQIDPVELLKRLEAGQDMESVIRSQLSARFSPAKG